MSTSLSTFSRGSRGSSTAAVSPTLPISALSTAWPLLSLSRGGGQCHVHNHTESHSNGRFLVSSRYMMALFYAWQSLFLLVMVRQAAYCPTSLLWQNDALDDVYHALMTSRHFHSSNLTTTTKVTHGPIDAALPVVVTESVNRNGTMKEKDGVEKAGQALRENKMSIATTTATTSAKTTVRTTEKKPLQTPLPMVRDGVVEVPKPVNEKSQTKLELPPSPPPPPPLRPSLHQTVEQEHNEKVEPLTPKAVEQQQQQSATPQDTTKELPNPTRIDSDASSALPLLNATSNSSPDWAAICAVTSHFERYVDDWTDYHLALGFDIFLYDTHPNFTLAAWYNQRVSTKVMMHNNETSQKTTSRRPKQRVHVSHYILPDRSKKLWGVQEGVYAQCLTELRAQPVPPKWVLVIDGDEYLVLRDMDRYPHIVPFLQERVPTGSLQFNWIVMGSAYEQEFDPTRPVPQRFPLAIVDDAHYDETKTVAVLDHVERVNIHYAELKSQGPDQGQYPSIGMGGRKPGSGGCLKGPSCIRHGDVSEAAIFHYKYMSHGEFNYRQCVRGAIDPNQHNDCPAVSRIGTKWDAAAWHAMQRLLPKYANPPPGVVVENPDALTKTTNVVAKAQTDQADAAKTITNSTAQWLALVAVVSDDRGNVTEWLDYHITMLGVGHVYIYDARSINTAATATDIATWQKQHIEANSSAASAAPQLTFLDHSVHIASSNNRTVVPTKDIVFRNCLADLRLLPNPPTWIVVLEADEYLVHKDLDIAKQQQRGNVNNITAYLVEHDATGSSQLNWVNRAVALGLTNTSSTGHARNTPVMQRF